MGQRGSKQKKKKKSDKLPEFQQKFVDGMRQFSNDQYEQSSFVMPNGIKLCIALGDICMFHGDAIVNAANEKMLGGGGVDGAIHRAAGDSLKEYIRDNIPTLPNLPHKRCLTGSAIKTPGFLLNTSWIIHAAGPAYRKTEEPHSLLDGCYRKCIELALESEMKSIAFSAISCGAFGFPKEEAMNIAFQVCNDSKYANSGITDIWFIVLKKEMYQICVDVANELFNAQNEAE